MGRPGGRGRGRGTGAGGLNRNSRLPLISRPVLNAPPGPRAVLDSLKQCSMLPHLPVTYAAPPAPRITLAPLSAPWPGTCEGSVLASCQAPPATIQDKIRLLKRISIHLSVTLRVPSMDSEMGWTDGHTESWLVPANFGLFLTI